MQDPVQEDRSFYFRRVEPKPRLVVVKELKKSILSHFPGTMSHVLFVGGLCSVAFGCWQIYHPLGPIVGGVLGVWFAFLVSAESNESNQSGKTKP